MLPSILAKQLQQGIRDYIIPIKQVTEIDDPIARQEAMIAEKCLLYVALTRAQRGAYVTSYGKKSEFLIETT